MTYRLSDISPAFKKRINDLRAYIREETLYKSMLERILDGLQGDVEFLDEAINLMLETQRVLMIHDAGIQTNQEFYSYYVSNDVKSWQKQNSPPVAPDLIQSLADKVYNMRSGQNDYGLLNIGENVRSVVEIMIHRLIKEKEDFDVLFTDLSFKARLLNASEKSGIQNMAEKMIAAWEPVTRRMVVVPGLPQEDIPDVADGKELYLQSLLKPVRDRIMNGEIHFTLTCIPSERDAAFDDIPYEDYLQLFFEMCDQPWDHIETAHRFLIAQLNQAKTLRFTNNDGTDISLSIDGMTFANSVIARNVPGSEVFSAPLRESANGKIIAKGVFSPSGTMKGERIEDIELTFKDGKCIEYHARIGEDILKKMIETDEGSCFLGEVAIGTNPHLKRTLGNISLVEKIGGSFHVAFGNPYTATEYMGEPIKFDNGNRSLIHWDITTMLHGKEGKIYVDGDLIMDHGKFLAPELNILNRGWDAIPVSQRPDYWKNYDFTKKKY